MKLEELLFLLEKKQLYVRRKSYFSDLQESQLPLKKVLPLHHVGQGFVPLSNDELDKEINAVNQKMQQYKLHNRMPVSCWTDGGYHNDLMWTAYAANHGVCIVSSIDKFVSSLYAADYHVWCGKVQYHKHLSCINSFECCFAKDTAYEDEREIRFLFIESNECNDNNDKDNKDHVLIGLDPLTMIEAVYLSPHMNEPAANALCGMLHDRYGITVKTLAQFYC